MDVKVSLLDVKPFKDILGVYTEMMLDTRIPYEIKKEYMDKLQKIMRESGCEGNDDVEEDENITPLLEIKVKDLNTLPEVKHKGELITGRIAIEYKWETKADVNTKHEYVIEHAIKQEDGVPIVRKVSEKLFG